MHIALKPGKYVVAVSGGIDSVVLLDLLARQYAGADNDKRNASPVRLTVAHFDHCIRSDSALDRRFVCDLAKKYRLPFVYNCGHLGAGASEETARIARYAFLRSVQEVCGAQGIITAHHKDDVIESAIINMARGTGRKGLSSLQSRQGMIRPLLGYTKAQIAAYAKEHNLEWRNDPTNQDPKYMRNRVRKALSQAGSRDKEKMHGLLAQAKTANELIDKLLAEQLRSQPVQNRLNRYWFIMLPHAVSREVMAAWLRLNGHSFDAKLIELLVVAAKTLNTGRKISISQSVNMSIGRDDLALTSSDR